MASIYTVFYVSCVFTNLFFIAIGYLTIKHNSAAIFSESFSFFSVICDIIIISPNP